MAGGPSPFGAGPPGANRGPDSPPDGPPPDEAGGGPTGPRRDFGNAPPMPAAMIKMIRSNMRAQNQKMYFDLKSRLGISADQANALLDLLTDEQTAAMRDARNMNPEQAREFYETQQAKRDAAIADLLGTSKAAEFADYQKTMPSRAELSVISQQLEGSEMPLNDDQRTKLLAALVDERERIPAPVFSEGTSPEQYRKDYNAWQADYEKRVADEARGILSADQYGTYNEYLTWQQQMREQFSVGPPGGPMRGGRGPMFMAAPASGVAFAVSSDAASTSPTEKTAKAR